VTRPPTIVAMGGGGFSQQPDDPRLDDYVLAATGLDRPRVCFLPTATSNVDRYLATFYPAFARKAVASHLDLFVLDGRDLRGFLLAQDVIYVGGGNTANMVAIWRLHGVDRILREAWDRGVVLAGLSAGGLCWFEQGSTDSFGPGLAALDGLLGFVPGSFCPHYDGEAMRRPRLHELVAAGKLGRTYACDDGAAVVFRGTELHEAIAEREGATAYRVELLDGAVRESALPTRLLL
jgi:dipeptidase E